VSPSWSVVPLTRRKAAEIKSVFHAGGENGYVEWSNAVGQHDGAKYANNRRSSAELKYPAARLVERSQMKPTLLESCTLCGRLHKPLRPADTSPVCAACKKRTHPRPGR
jgi:hypothetical protein